MDSTLAKGLAVLDWLARQQRDCRVVDVAQAFGLARSNAHRTLQTLVECGWVVQNAVNSTNRSSLRLIELGSLVEDGLDLKALTHPLLAELAQSSGEAIHLTVLEGTEIIYLDKFDSPLPVAAYSRIGGRAPAYCVASGKALLAAHGHDANSLRALLRELVAHTPNTHTDFDVLHAELQRGRSRGWAENRQEWRLGVCGLGAPIFNARGQPVAAIGLSVPSIRFQRAQVRSLSEQLVACARRASQQLGHGQEGEFTPARSIPDQRRQS
jgi:DNA-binding IclR family transcriptional regulator